MMTRHFTVSRTTTITPRPNSYKPLKKKLHSRVQLRNASQGAEEILFVLTTTWDNIESYLIADDHGPYCPFMPDGTER